VFIEQIYMTVCRGICTLILAFGPRSVCVVSTVWQSAHRFSPHRSAEMDHRARPLPRRASISIYWLRSGRKNSQVWQDAAAGSPHLATIQSIVLLGLFIMYSRDHAHQITMQTSPTIHCTPLSILSTPIGAVVREEVNCSG
jgi:hypothetical protein